LRFCPVPGTHSSILQIHCSRPFTSSRSTLIFAAASLTSQSCQHLRVSHHLSSRMAGKMKLAVPIGGGIRNSVIPVLPFESQHFFYAACHSSITILTHRHSRSSPSSRRPSKLHYSEVSHFRNPASFAASSIHPHSSVSALSPR